MTTFAWPDALTPQSVSWGIHKAAVQFRSPMGGSVQSVEFPASYWYMSITLPQAKMRNGGAAEAFFSRLAGGVERVLVPYWPRRIPAGTMRGAPVLAAAAGRGDLVLVVTANGTLRAGDMIGVGAQVFQCVTDCADVAGTLTVPLVNRVRGPMAAGTAVVWNTPTVLCLVPSVTSTAVYAPGMQGGIAVDLEEA